MPEAEFYHNLILPVNVLNQLVVAGAQEQKILLHCLKNIALRGAIAILALKETILHIQIRKVHVYTTNHQLKQIHT